MSTINRGRQVITLVVSCLGTFMVFLDASVVVLALPTIQANLHASLTDLQWTVDAYTLSFAALLLAAGTLNDRFGRKRLFLIGLILFLCGSALCGFAPTLGWLIIGRVIQGVGGAALSPGSLSLLAAAFPEPRTRARVIGLWSGFSGLALAAGPMVGGLLIQVASWPAIFFINLPIGALALILGLPGLVESRNPHARNLDLLGQILVIGILTSLIMALIESSSFGWSSPVILGLLGCTVVLTVAFLLVETRVHEPLFPLNLFKSSLFSAANVATIALNFAILGVVFFLAQFFQTVQGSTVLVAGLQTLPVTVGTFLVAPIAGQITARFGPRLPTVVGSLLTAGGLFLLIDLSPASDFASIWWKLGMLGVGFGLTFAPLTEALLAATPQARAGLASSLVSTCRQIGATLGVAVLGALVLQQFAGNIVSQLTVRGVPGQASSSIAGKIASAGAQASHIPVAGRLPLPPASFHQAISQAFVDSLHASFLIAGIVALAVALMVLFLFPRKRQLATQSVATLETPVTAEVSDKQPVATTDVYGVGEN